jgi:hypothetical protein
MKIQVTIKNIYDNQLIYPVCEKAKYFTELTKTKTLNQNDIDTIKKLGFEIELIQNNINL